MAPLFCGFWGLVLLVQPLLGTGVAHGQNWTLRKDLVALLQVPRGHPWGGSIYPRHQHNALSVLHILLGAQAARRLSPVQAQSSSARLSSFLHNISMYLQSGEAALELRPESQPWEQDLLALLLPLAEKLWPPSASRWHFWDFLFSLRGSWNWDVLLSLFQNLSLPSRGEAPSSRHWELFSNLMEALGQALLSGLLGPQGTLCSPREHNGCPAGASWLAQFVWLFEGAGWKPLVHVRPAGRAPSQGHVKSFGLPLGNSQELLPGNRSAPSRLLKVLYRAEQAGLGRQALNARGGSDGDVLWEALEELRQSMWPRVGPVLIRSFQRRVSRVTGMLVAEASGSLDPDGKCFLGSLQQLLVWGIKHNISWNAHSLGFSSKAFPVPPPMPSCLFPEGWVRQADETLRHATKRAFPELRSIAEVLEAVCNESIPGLPGVSNFTVYLYCNLFNSSKEPTHPLPDLEALCSDASWYLSFIDRDSVWVLACSAYFPDKFNTTVCGNASLLGLPGTQELCANLSMPSKRSRCLEALSRPPLSQEDAWNCFLENQTLWTQSLCSSSSLQELEEGPRQWMSVLCVSPQLPRDALNASARQSTEGCDARAWSPQALYNTSLLVQCGAAHVDSFRTLVCSNGSLLEALRSSHPWVDIYCLAAQQEANCFHRWLPAVLPLPSNLDTSGLCQDPPAFLLGLASQLAQCTGSSSQWALSTSYLLQLLDFLLSLPALDEVRQAARQQVGQALLLSSLLDNSSSAFWASFQANLSFSILQDVSKYLQQEQDTAAKEDLWSCFGPLLWDMLHREENISTVELFMQEYIQMPQEIVQKLLQSAESETIQRFLALLHRSWPHVQVPPWDEQALELLASRLLGKFSQLTPQLVLHLSHFVPFMALSDIMRLPPILLANESVLAIISSHSTVMKQEQKQALVRRLLQAERLSDVPSWPLSFLRSIQPLLPNLPLRRFLQLTPQQIQSLADGWQEAKLGMAQGRHVVRSLINKSHESTEEQMRRLGSLTCFLSFEDLQLVLLWGSMEQHLLECMANGLVSPRGQLAQALLERLHSGDQTAMAPTELHAWRGLVPAMGMIFLQGLSDSQLEAFLAELQATQLSPAQAALLLSQALQLENVTAGEGAPLCKLLAGLSPQSLEVVMKPVLAKGCECLGPSLPRLSRAQKAALLQALQRHSPESLLSSTQLDCLLPAIPLKLMQVDAQDMLGRSSWYQEAPWSPQQAQLLWQEIEGRANVTQDLIRALGNLATGMPCATLQKFGAKTDFLAVLEALYSQSGSLPCSLRGCIWKEIQRRPALSIKDMRRLGPQFLMDLPAHLVDKLPGEAILLILGHIRRHSWSLLELPPPRRATLAQRTVLALQRPQWEAAIPGEALDLLGPLVGFLAPDLVSHIHPESLLQHLDELREACLDKGFAKELGRLLVADHALGDPALWSHLELDQLGLLVFLLPPESIRRIPKAVLSKDTVEQLLQSQRAWEESEVGQRCGPRYGAGKLREQKDALVKGLVRRNVEGEQDPVPSCSDIRATFPSAWSAAQIHAMRQDHFRDCLSLISQDAQLRPDQCQAALRKARQILGPVWAMGPVEIMQLGFLALHLRVEELQELDISDWEALSVLGDLEGWTDRQMRTLVRSFVRQSKANLQDLELPDLVALGHLLCGLQVAEIKQLNSYEFSKAAHFLGSLTLSCSEDKMEALAHLLLSPSAFGPVVMWGPEIFTEIGTLAAGLPDILLSALVPEQLQGLTTQAMASISALKFAVVFSPAQLLSLTSSQASAVTPQQYKLLSPEQRQAVATALLEGEISQDLRGRSRAELHPVVSQLLLFTLLCLGATLALQ